MEAADEWVTDDAINRALGAEVRRLRAAAGMSRAQLVRKLPFSLHIQTLQNYELGLRQFPLGKLLAISRLLGTPAHELYRKAIRAAELAEVLFVEVDLSAVLASSDTDLEALRTWARNRPAGPGEVVRLHRTVVQELAAVLGFSTETLVKRLEEFRPTDRTE